MDYWNGIASLRRVQEYSIIINILFYGYDLFNKRLLLSKQIQDTGRSRIWVEYVD